MEFQMDLDDPGAYSDDDRVNKHDNYVKYDGYADTQLEYEMERGKLLRSRQDDRPEVIIKEKINDEKQTIDVNVEEQEEEGTMREEDDTPPENFSPVAGEIYRSSFPRPENFKFLAKLKLKSILVLIPEEYPRENLDFVQEQGINVFQVGMSGNKEPFVNIPPDVLTRALEIAINPSNHPLLIHCNRGKHRTGCLVGCIRRLQNWSLTMIFDEYRRFAAPKARPLDQQFIEMYNESDIVDKATKEGWLPIQW
ncbi:CYFA0S01e05138g1_1 [Cyberlindnera fabianii]|uniref:diphosphoinositol-polyphosphate diphosphatase n=1 Tax=Cyberlindnera fabianii TaxID=36022 RepID=A0A061AH06_CYBFA|nr:CYFA0S01e05138g1_1 [Cyberlindnera fabianii]